MTEQESQKVKLSPAAVTGIILLVLCGISLYIRIALPYDQVFVHGSVWFKGTDAWYHMRLIDNLVHHFPHRIFFDPYIYYPGGGTSGWMPFFDLLVGGVAWLVGLGSPSQHTIDVVGAYAPAVLGTLTIIPAYFIGKELFNRWVGWLSAALVVILPGEFLNRSLLGFTDHHVAEALFSTTAMLFLILAIKKAGEREISFGHFLSRDWSTITKPLIYALLAGVFLGIYLLTWMGGLLFIFIIFLFLLIQFIIDHLRHKSTDYLCIIGVLIFLISFVMVLPFLSRGGLPTIYHASFLVAILALIALSGISRLMARKAIRPFYYPLALVGLAGIGLAAFYAIDPSLLHSMLGRFRIFTPSGAQLTIKEVHPLLFPYGHFSLRIAWLNFTTSFFICFIALGWLIYRNIKEESADKTLFLVWSVIMLAAALSQRRFSYYYAINAALLTGYFSWRILDFAGLGKLKTKPEKEVKKFKKRGKVKEKTRQKTFLQPRATWIKVIMAGVAIFFLVFFPNIGKAEALAKSPALITEGWHSSLLWLKDSSPEPFDDPDFYYELYPPRCSFKYPETAYGVMSWWDYGHWITRVAHRLPHGNPGGGFRAKTLASFFLCQDEDSANQIMDKLGSKYVMVDHTLPTSKFYAMPEWAGKSEDEFYETYYQAKEGGKLERIILFYPTYYRSMVVRLYNFDGKAVVPQETIVISYEERLSREGVRYKQITKSWSFPTYEEAEAHISSQESGNYRIVSPNPFTTPVPLEELNHYKLVHQSHTTVAIAGKKLPEVKTFEYVK